MKTIHSEQGSLLPNREANQLFILKYSLGREDVPTANEAVMRAMYGPRWVRLLVALICIPLLVWSFNYTPEEKSSFLGIASVLIMLTSIVILFMLLIPQLFTYIIFTFDPNKKVPHQLIMDKHFMTCTEPEKGRVNLPWEALEYLYQTDAGVLLWFMGGNTLWVPERAFGKYANKSLFAHFAQSQIEACKDRKKAIKKLVGRKDKEALYELLMQFFERNQKGATYLELFRTHQAIESSTCSKFGGIPYTNDTPVCGRCKSPLVFIAQFNMQEMAHVVNDDALYVFHYCMECQPTGERSTDNKAWKVERLTVHADKQSPVQSLQGGLVPCFSQMSFVPVVPSWGGMFQHEEEVFEVCAGIDKKDPESVYWGGMEEAEVAQGRGTTIGGYPLWLDEICLPRCKKCSRLMPMFVQLDCEIEAGLEWPDNGMIYLFQCPEHLDEFSLAHVEMPKREVSLQEDNNSGEVVIH